MFAHVENGKVTFRGYLPKNWRNVSGLDLSKDNSAFLKSIGWLALTEVDVELDKNEVKDGEDILIEDDKVTITHKKRVMTDDEIKTRDEDAMSSLRDRRDRLLEETDQYALSDRTLTDEMRTYRDRLRKLPETVDITDIQWPEKPS